MRTGDSLANADRDSDGNSHTDSYANGYSDSYAYTDSYANCDSNSYPYTDSYAYVDAYGPAESKPDTKAISDTAASPDSGSIESPADQSRPSMKSAKKYRPFDDGSSA